MTNYGSPDQLKASPEYQALGVIGRQRLFWETFPDLHEQHLNESADHLAAAAHPDPKEDE